MKTDAPGDRSIRQDDILDTIHLDIRNAYIRVVQCKHSPACFHALVLSNVDFAEITQETADLVAGKLARMQALPRRALLCMDNNVDGSGAKAFVKLFQAYKPDSAVLTRSTLDLSGCTLPEEVRAALLEVHRRPRSFLTILFPED